MLAEKFAQWLRIPAIVLVSVVVASCGSGSGEDSVEVSADDVAASRLELVFADYFGDPPAANSRAAAKAIPRAALSAGNWVVDTGYGNNGWGNDEWQRYDNSMDNLFTENGNLVLRARCATAPACGKRDDSITSAKVTSKDRINVRYGIIKARIKMPSGVGMWPAFWTLGSDIEARPWPDAGELDIVEMHYYYSDTRTTHFSTHWAGPRYTDDNRPVCSSGVAATDPAEEENCGTASKTFDKPLTDGFHVYEMEWNENVIVGKIDGITYFTQAIDPSTMEEFLKDHYLILNVAVGGTLGGPFGPSMSAGDWSDRGQTDMLVDWVEVYQRVPDTRGTLIDEDGGNLSYNRIINSAELFGGASVKSDLESRAVTPLKGDSVLKLKYSTSRSENGGTPAEFSAAIFDFNNIDLSDYSKVRFSINSSEFRSYRSIGVEFQDSRTRAVEVRTPGGGARLIDTDGDWRTYEIPLNRFAGVDMSDVVAMSFSNPKDSNGNLIAGKLYVDDIRFLGSDKCKVVPTVAFDSLNYNPNTNVAAVSVSDACAANSLALVTVDNGSEEIMVAVDLDAAGNGQGLFNLVGGNSVCSSDDSSGILQMSGTLMAEYKRAKTARGGSLKATSMAGIDPGAPGTSLTADQSYFYATDEDVNPLSFFPDNPNIPNTFNYSFFGSGSDVGSDGSHSDADFSKVWRVQSGTGYGAEVAQLVLVNITTGFPVGKKYLIFKTKDQPNNIIRVEMAAYGDNEFVQGRDVDLSDTELSTPVPGTTGWYQVRLPIQGEGWFTVSQGQLINPITDFSRLADYNGIGFVGGGTAPASQYAYLLTDIALEDPLSNVPEECEGEVQPPVSGSGFGDTGATGGPNSVSFDDMGVTYDFVGFGNPDTITTLGNDPLKSENLVALTTKPDGAQVWAGVTAAPMPGVTYPVTVAQSEISIRIYSPGPGVNVRMKLEESGDATHSVETEATTTVDTGWETLTLDFNNEVDGTPALNEAFTYDKLSLFFGFGTPGDGTTYTWDTVEFLGGGGSEDVMGCTDAAANNYNPAATVDDGSCTYDGPAQVDLPVSFDEANVDYSLVDFGGNASSLVADPTDGGNMVVQSVKAGDAQLWAGTTIGAEPNGFASAIPFSAGNTSMTVRVYSPDAGIPVRLKVEDATNAGITVETEAMTTGVNTWETLTFNFSNEAAGTAALNLANTYDKASIFFNFGTDGATAGEKTYLWDDVEFVGGGEDVQGCTDAAANNYNPAATVDDGSCTYDGPTQVDLPVSFDEANVDYSLVDFGGNASSLVADPTDGGNMVVQSVKAGDAQLWAGTTIGAEPNGFASAIPFSAGNTSMTVRVYSPDAGIPVRLKVEDATNAGITVETEAMTTGVNTWETLSFNFSNEAAGTAALNLANTYDKASIFFNFGTDGATAGEKTYLWDDVEFVGGGEDVMGCTDAAANNYNPAATVDDGSCTYDGGNVGGGPTGDFEDPAITYAFTDFGGNASSLVADPTDAGNTVAQSVKAGDAQLWAGTTLGDNMTDNGALPFTVTDTRITVRVFSPEAGIPVRLKVEDITDPTITVETEAMTTVANAWETLTFDFSNEVAGTAALNLANTYNKLSIFFNFGTDGAGGGGGTFLWDDVEFSGGGEDVQGCTDVAANNYNPAATVDDGSCTYDGLNQVDLPVTFDAADVDYSLTDFGDSFSELVADPEDGANTVVRTMKPFSAPLWAGTTIGAAPNGFATAIPFTASDSSMTVRVYSPDAGIPVRLKVEDAGDPTITVETEAMTTGVNTWETLTFNFSNEAAGTAALNLANTYDKASIFFNFGTDGATAGDKMYYWDDVEFVTGEDVMGCTDAAANNYNPAATVDDGSCTYDGPAQVDLPVSFDEANVDYSLVDFGGNASSLVADPTDGGNMVVQSVKAGDAQLWAGTTIGAEPNGFASAIPFSAGNTSMTVRVYSPDAGIPVRLKVEDATNAGITVETEAMTTGVNTWETLTFNFSNEAAGTAALNLANTYDKASIFFNFGTDGATAGEKTYLWDDVEFVGGGEDVQGCTDAAANNYNPAATVDDGSCTYDGGNPGDELVTNGDFETGGTDGWLAIDTPPNNGTIETDNLVVSPNNGSMVSVKITSLSGNNPVLKQERFAAASLSGGDSVTVKFDIFATLGIGSVLSAQLITEIAAGGVSKVEDLIPPNDDWTSDWANYSFTTTVGNDTSGGISLQFVAIGGGGTMILYVDNVSIVLN